MFLFSFHIMPHALLTSFISVQCMAMFSSSLPFCHRRAVASCFTSFLFHGYAWCMPLTHAATYLGYVGTSIVDMVQTCTHTTGSIKGRKCQPENSSLVLLVFPHYNQWDHLRNRLLADLVRISLLRFPRVPVDAGYLWVVLLECSPDNCFCLHR